MPHASRASFAPDDPITRADPRGGHALLEAARSLAKGETLRASLLFEMGQAGLMPGAVAGPNQALAQSAAPTPDPIRDFAAYLAEYPKGPDRRRARFHLGEAQLAAGQPLPARLTWTDLAAEIAKAPPDPESADLRALALYQVSRTYGIPTPADDASLNLGVAALRRFLADFPGHPRAPRAAFEIGAAYLHRGRGEPAIEALTAFLKGDGYRVATDEARREVADLTMTATFRVAQTLQSQGRFDRAIEAYRAYLAKFPDGPSSANAQRAILAAELQIAAEALSREKFAEARAAWAGFVARNPLDARVPQVLYDSAESLASEKKWDEAVLAWDFPRRQVPRERARRPRPVRRRLRVRGREGRPGRRDRAVPQDRPARLEGPGRPARRRDGGEGPRPSSPPGRSARARRPSSGITTRGTSRTLTFAAYKLNAEAYFRKKHRPRRRPVRSTSAWSPPTPSGPPRCKGLRASSSRSPRPTTSRSPCPASTW